MGPTRIQSRRKLKPRHGTMDEALASAEPALVGVPIVVNVPDAGKLSVNIVGPRGEVLRELCGGVEVKPGKFTVKWDGRDQWGVPLTPEHLQKIGVHICLMA